MNLYGRSRHAETSGAWSRRLRRVCLALLIACVPVAVAPAAEPELPALAAPGSPRLPGKFIWADLATTDVAAAQNFYAALFGWTFRAMGEAAGGYVIAYKDDRPLGGLVTVRPRPGAAGTPRWVTYISVDDVAATSRAILGAGGRELVRPQLLAGRGEQAVFADPEGTVFGVMRTSAGDPEDYLAEPGEWIWIQLLARDVGKAISFYGGVGGYDVVENVQSPRLDDYLLAKGEFARAAVSALPADHPQLRPAWIPFVRVDDLAGVVGRVPSLGGRVVSAPRPENFEGRLAVVTDPGGALVGLLKWDDEGDEERKRRQ